MRDYNIPDLTIRQTLKEGFSEVVFKGDMDHVGLEEVRENLELMIDDLKLDNIVFNFTDLEFVNSEGIGFIIMLHSRLVKKLKNLIIVGMKDHVKDVLDVIGVTKIIKNFVTTEDWIKNK